MAVFVLDRKGYDHLTRSPTGEVGRYLHSVGARLTILAQNQVGVDTGALKASMRYKVTRASTGLIVTVGSNNKIAYIHHEGARPHIIRAKNANVLRFYSRGRIVYTPVVRHPGTRPNRYLTDNLPRVI